MQVALGIVVRARREEMGITQDELAWRADMHRTYIADIERGARNVSLRSFVNLATALQVGAGRLLSNATGTGEGSHGPAKPAKAGGARAILLVEDNEADAALTVRAFRRAKVTNPVKVVSSAEDALDHLSGASRRRTLPQLILLDLNLPGMSGLEFLARIKKDERTRDVPVVVLTVSQSDQMILECRRLGAEQYIIKPVGIEGVIRVTPKVNLHLTFGPEGAEGPAAV